jgi:predicted AlkP superfamily pyrophosphatase or phosphodiesterase
VAGRLLEYQNIATQIGGAWRIKLKLAVDVAINADLGPRDIVVRFGNGDTTTGERSLEVDRRRLVIFAIDGLSKTQFDAAKSDMSPPVLGRSHGTALHRIFQDSVTRGQVVDRELITTFPPITYTRWASVFSGQTPGETRVHANQWFNRHALINGSEFGDVDQRLGLGTAGQVNNVLFSAGAYNRHFDTDLVFDELRRAGLRSIVIGHQVGLGRSMRGERRLSGTGNDEWRRWDPELVAFAAAGTVMGRVAVETGSKIVARAMDGFGSRTAVDEISASHAQFDLMVVYLPGLDHLIHDAGAPDETAREYFADSLHGAINAVVRSLREYQDSTVFAVMSDHGHYATSLDRAIDVDDTGSATGSVSLRRALQPQRRYLVSPTFQDSPGNANVIAVPQFGLANVYVAAGRRTDGRADWTRPPDAQQLEPLVNSLFEQYVRGREWDSRPMADIFVRSPGPTFTGSTYLAVPRNYDPNKMCGEARCGLFGQLVAPDQDHLGQGIGDNFDGNDANWSYIAPAERLARSISANSGDIVLMANGRYGYQFGAAYKAQHGSLTLMDARVPIAFGFGAATGGPNEDTILQPVVRFLQSFTDDYEHLAEAEAIRKFLLPSP